MYLTATVWSEMYCRSFKDAIRKSYRRPGDISDMFVVTKTDILSQTMLFS